ncbi:MAG: hypothetical protein ABR66_04805 [Microbacteriaceae bacterium BACL25 MAG-120322-bin65]|nr:MAG: hypothetical protein ABR66_04805 [Microbacteriaceae bacterium BACL25 MAG-120322-bin65]HAA79366.1 sodium-independent anion transporter [Microbacteriaceae bacterium]
MSGGEWETLGNKRTLTDFFTTLRFDLVAGSTVAIVALPLALGFGVTSGAGAASGLVTAIVAGFVAGLLGGSNFQVSGPTGAMVVVLFPIIAQVGTSGLLVVGVVAGLLIVLSGLFKLGRFVELVPWSVMEGFTLGIAVVIALQQLPLILEITRGEGTETLLVAWGTIQNAAAEPLHWWPLAVVTLTLTVKIGWSLLRNRIPALASIPASGIAVVVMTMATWAFALPVQKIGALPTSNLFTWDLSWPDLGLGTILYSAVVIAALGSIESLLSARVADAMVKRRDGELFQPHRPNRELMGQGLATIAASLLGGMPATGAIARTAVNVHSGARTRMATVIHSLVLLVFVTSVGFVVGQIPTAVLAGVLLGASWRIANPVSIMENLRTTWSERVSYLATALAVVTIDLIWGIAIGIVVHIVMSKMTTWRERDSL